MKNFRCKSKAIGVVGKAWENKQKREKRTVAHSTRSTMTPLNKKSNTTRFEMIGISSLLRKLTTDELVELVAVADQSVARVSACQTACAQRTKEGGSLFDDTKGS